MIFSRGRKGGREGKEKGRKERERRKNTQRGRDRRREKGRGIGGGREIMLFLDSLKFNLGGVKASVGITCHLNGPMKRLLLRLTLYCLQLLLSPLLMVRV